MPLPVGVETVTVSSGQPLTLPDGTPVEGTLYFSSPDVVTIAGEDVLLGGEVPPVELVGGEFSVALVATDATGMSPTGWTYTVRAVLTNAPSWKRYISLPKANTSVKLADVVVPDPVAGSFSTLIDASAVAAAYLAKGQNLADLPSKPTARSNLGLGGSAVLDVGSAANTVAAGDDPRFGQSKPWVFDVTAPAYGAVGDGRVLTDGAMTSGAAVLTCTTSSPFTAADIGKTAIVLGAGPAGVTSLVAAITGVTDAGHATLAAAASATVTGAIVMYGTDDSAAFLAAGEAAVTWALAHGKAATLVLPAPPTGEFYMNAGTLQTGKQGNAQFPLPVVPSTGPKVTLVIEGPFNGAGVQHWEQTVPQLSGATIVSAYVHASASAQTASINAHGNACVIGGPSQPGGYGVAPGVFSNMHLVVRNLSVLTTHSANGLTLSAFDFSGIANVTLENVAYGTAATVAGNWYASPGSFANGLCPGLLMPASGNNDLCVIRNVTCLGGYTYGAFVTEHTDVYALRILYCWAAFCPVGTYYSSVGSTHAIVATLLSIEACTYLVYIIGGGSSGVGPFIHLRIDTETGLPRFGDNNNGFAASTARGDVYLTGLYTASSLTLDAPVGYDIIDGQRSYPNVNVSADYTVSTMDELVTVDASGAGRTITLPTAVGRNRRIVVTKTDASVNTVTVAAAGTQTISGAATKVLAAQWATAELLPTAAGNWIAL